MKSRVLPVLSIALLGTILTGQAGATVINFDNLSDGTILTNQYAGVTFSSSGGDSIIITHQNLVGPFGGPPYNGSVPNLICTGSVALPVGTVTIDCTHDLIIDFSSPVNNLTFDAFGNQTPAPGTFALADVFLNFSPIAAALNVPLRVSHITHCAAPTLDCDPDPQDFSAFPGITELIIHNNTDTAGTAYDNLSFTSLAAPNPEPSTLFLMGFVGFAWAGRRFLTRKSR